MRRINDNLFYIFINFFVGYKYLLQNQGGHIIYVSIRELMSKNSIGRIDLLFVLECGCCLYLDTWQASESRSYSRLFLSPLLFSPLGGSGNLILHFCELFRIITVRKWKRFFHTPPPLFQWLNHTNGEAGMPAVFFCFVFVYLISINNKSSRVRDGENFCSSWIPLFCFKAF